MAATAPEETYMFNLDVEEISWGAATLRLEPGRVARQAYAAAFASLR